MKESLIACLVFVAFGFLYVRISGIVPLVLRTSADGFELQITPRTWRTYRWDALKAVRYHRWLNCVDLFLAHGTLLSRKVRIFNLSRKDTNALVDDIKRLAPTVKFKRF